MTSPPEPSLHSPSQGQRETFLDQWAAFVAGQTTQRLSEETAPEAPSTGDEYRRQTEAAITTVLDEAARDALTRQGRIALDADAEAEIRRRALARVCGLGPLQPLLDDARIENINLIGSRVLVRYADGHREERPAIVGSEQELIALVRRLAAESVAGERRFDPASPILNVPLADGSRMHAVMDVSHTVAVSIRRHRYRSTSLGELRRLETLDDALVALLRASVHARLNVVVTGATGAGKTTLLKAMASEVPPIERVITIEDTPELGLEREPELHPDCVALHSRPPNVEGAGEITMSALVRSALRMSPDRVIVGETLGEETLPLLKAMTQGTKGSLTTLHADSSEDAFARFCAYAVDTPQPVTREEVAMLFGPAVDLVVHLASTPRGQRLVTRVREIVGTDGTQVVSNEIYRRDRQGRPQPAAPPSPPTAHALGEGGFDTARLLHSAEGWSP